MIKDIKYKFAEDENGVTVFVTSAISGKKYHCSDCKEEMIFKNGNIRQKHFSHKNIENCGKGTGEGYLHATFKHLLLQHIKGCITEKKPLEISWICNICNGQHNFNLIQNIVDIKTEFALENCRPDLVLFDTTGRVPAIIEIVDKHEPETNVLELCKKYSLFLVRIKLDSLSDLENIENKIKLPSNVYIFNPMQCPIARQKLQQPRVVFQPSMMNYRGNVMRGSLIDNIDQKMNQSNYGNRKQSYGRGNHRSSHSGRGSGRRK